MDTTDDIPNELKARLFQNLKRKYKRCLWPFKDCKKKPSRSHSIQNALTLDLLHRSGHVIMPRQNIKLETGPEITFQPVSRHKASTFTGLCQVHDSELFRPIDTNGVDASNPEHLFLAAYRSVTKEYHATLRGVQAMQAILNDAVSAGTSDSNASSPAVQLATGRILDSYETYLYWMELNCLLEKGDFSDLQHIVISLPSTRACLAASSMFPLEITRQQAEVPPSLILNVLPETNGTHTAIFSHLPEDSELVNDALSRITKATGYYLLYEVSKLIIERCENFVLAPDVYDRFSNAKRDAILTFFSGNMAGLGLQLNMNSMHLMLFE
jgi:hypothetical protein